MVGYNVNKHFYVAIRVDYLPLSRMDTDFEPVTSRCSVKDKNNRHREVLLHMYGSGSVHTPLFILILLCRSLILKMCVLLSVL